MRRPAPAAPDQGPSWPGFVNAALVPFVVAGGLLSLPLTAAGLMWPVYLAFGGVGVSAAFVAAPRSAWRDPVPVAFVAAWVVFAAWAPYALAHAPNAKLGGREVTSLASCGVLCVASLLFVGGRRRGLTGLRMGWAFGLVLAVAIAGWELTTGSHLWVGPANPWPFGTARIAVATYQNPNNFAGALVAMIAGTLALAADSARPLRFGLWALSGVGAVVVFLTGSRSGLGALGVVVALEVWRLVREHHEGVRLRDLLRAHRRLVGAAAAAGVVGVAALAFLPGVSRNPVRRLLLGWADPETARSDGLRAGLIRAAWRYLRESRWMGSGAGSFEPLLWADPHANVIKLTNLHNAFVELVSQYGVVVGGVFTLAGATIVTQWCRSAAAWHHRVGAQARAARVARHEALGYAAAFVAFGLSASSALPYQTWWMCVGSAAATVWAWRVDAPARITEPDGHTHADGTASSAGTS